ncbi:MAG: hypothetical protein QXP99_03165 [Thermoproteota archaeon]
MKSSWNSTASLSTSSGLRLSNVLSSTRLCRVASDTAISSACLLRNSGLRLETLSRMSEISLASISPLDAKTTMLRSVHIESGLEQ